MFLADPPSDLDVTGVVNWHNGVGYPHAAFNTSYGATYWSWISWFDNYSQETILEPPSGFLAAIMAFTDNNAEPWFAPAGLTRGRIVEGLDVEHSPDQGERDFLYGNGNAVNPIVNSINFGIFVRGQRTLQRSPTALDRVNVRRLLLVLRKVVATSIARLEFEPNDATTRDHFKAIITPFLEDVAARRGIEDFSIIVDESTNPPAVVNRNELRGKILLKPVKVAEIIVVEFTLLPSGATFAESLQ
jgi:phage tail sheath protein FI